MTCEIKIGNLVRLEINHCNSCYARFNGSVGFVIDLDSCFNARILWFSSRLREFDTHSWWPIGKDRRNNNAYLEVI